MDGGGDRRGGHCGAAGKMPRQKAANRPTAFFVVGVFIDKAAAKTFRDEARERVEGYGLSS